jgi:DNA-binding beta-propeller fold protein YncE
MRLSLATPLAAAGLGAALLSALLAGCAVDRVGDAHPAKTLDYPVGVTADPSGRYVWVTSGNFDLRWAGGAVLALDLATHTFVPGATIEVGSYPGAFHLLADEGGASRHGYVASREENTLFHAAVTWVDGAPRLDCGDAGVPQPNGTLRCLDAKVTEADITDPEGVEDPKTLTVGSDPFGVLVRPSLVTGEPDLLLTGAMVSGNAATFELDPDTGVPTLAGNLDLRDGTFAFVENRQTRRIYASSKLSSTITVLRVQPPDPDEPAPYGNPWLHKVREFTLPASLVSDHARSMALTPDGATLVTSHRSPHALVITDVRETSLGNATDRVLYKVPVGKRPGDVVIAPALGAPGAPGALPLLAYVSCFSVDRIDVVDLAQGEVIASIPTGRGPFGLAFVDNPTLGLRRLYVANFYAHSVGVIELDPTSPYFHTQIAEARGEEL